MRFGPFEFRFHSESRLSRQHSLLKRLSNSLSKSLCIKTEPVVGWRCWLICDGRLISPSMLTEWPFRKSFEVSDSNWYKQEDGYNGIFSHKTRDEVYPSTVVR